MMGLRKQAAHRIIVYLPSSRHQTGDKTREIVQRASLRSRELLISGSDPQPVRTERISDPDEARSGQERSSVCKKKRIRAGKRIPEQKSQLESQRACEIWRTSSRERNRSAVFPPRENLSREHSSVLSQSRPHRPIEEI